MSLYSNIRLLTYANDDDVAAKLLTMYRNDIFKGVCKTVRNPDFADCEEIDRVFATRLCPGTV